MHVLDEIHGFLSLTSSKVLIWSIRLTNVSTEDFDYRRSVEVEMYNETVQATVQSPPAYWRLWELR